MKSHRVTLIAFVGVVLATVVAMQSANPQAPTGATERWEHMAVQQNGTAGLGDGQFSRQIIQIGSNGWQLVDVETIVEDGSTTKSIYFFKRPKD